MSGLLFSLRCLRSCSLFVSVVCVAVCYFLFSCVVCLFCVCVSCDGSLKKPVGNHWAIGGLGIWWPKRSKEEGPLHEEDGKYLEHEWRDGGCMQWSAFNERRNSSTRCEVGGARMAIQKDGPVHIGIDNQATVTMCNAIAGHHKRRQETKLRNEWGAMIVGGATSPLQRESLSKRPWPLTEIVDLWQSIEEDVVTKGPRSVKVIKVKGHTTNEVEEGKIKREEKEGNDASDIAADRGAEKTELTAAVLGFVYARRHTFYKILMARVQAFIIKVRKAESEKREKKRKQEEPFRKAGEVRKVAIPKRLKFGRKKKRRRRGESEHQKGGV